MTSKLTFHIERDGKFNVLTYKDGGCRPATPGEIELWDALLAPTQQPSGEVTDAMVDAAVAAYDSFPCPFGDNVSRFPHRGQLRAALQAAIDAARAQGGDHADQA
ncbi:hypothetical protein [Burkholderia pseudomultivorans]|uniref:hypothetical protein n=1 Tax=Burkholderia pseudomultivorans TaxID=1207504 RepID=UPI00075B8C28|nr:hypothetical protein [Burkholderia pseudomultivorans]KVC19731.1 hypothetical protein WS55_22725 [Burkholderia pseudomultivorans]KVC32082.1 hypothetical protein WS56_14330 [Burkholderia pseudomultivorans]